MAEVGSSNLLGPTRIYHEISHLERKPGGFFMSGDWELKAGDRFQICPLSATYYLT